MDRIICVLTAGIKLIADFRCANASAQVTVQTLTLTALTGRFQKVATPRRSVPEADIG